MAASDPLYPTTNVSDPVIWWIDRAIDEARKKLPKEDPEHAKDPYYIFAYALAVIIKTRELAKGSSHPNCGNMNLAYADHYLQMRVNAFNLGPKARGFLTTRARWYDDVKGVALKNSVTRWAMKTGVCDPTPVTAEEKYWAKRGLEDGLKDYENYPDKSILPFRHPLNFAVGLF